MINNFYKLVNNNKDSIIAIAFLIIQNWNLYNNG